MLLYVTWVWNMVIELFRKYATLEVLAPPVLPKLEMKQSRGETKTRDQTGFLCQIWICLFWTFCDFIRVAYKGKNVVFIFIIDYSSLRDFDSYVIVLFLYEGF
jgi:hypothetical protein